MHTMMKKNKPNAIPTVMVSTRVTALESGPPDEEVELVVEERLQEASPLEGQLAMGTHGNIYAKEKVAGVVVVEAVVGEWVVWVRSTSSHQVVNIYSPRRNGVIGV